MDELAIIVFARHPTPGRAKTRLAAGIGPDGAALFYKHCAELVIQECLKTSAAAIYIAFSALEEEDQMRAWLAPLPNSDRLTYLPQLQSPNLGDRLAHSINYVLSPENHHHRHHRQAIVLGTDVPDLTSAHLDLACATLHSNDAVFGPAEDGGYYLIGLKGSAHVTENIQSVFEGVEWSTAAVLQQNADNVHRAGLSLAPLDSLETLRDIDTVEDLKEWVSMKNDDDGVDEDGHGREEHHPLLKIAQTVLDAALDEQG